MSNVIGVVVAQEIPNLLAWVRFLHFVPNSFIWDYSDNGNTPVLHSGNRGSNPVRRTKARLHGREVRQQIATLLYVGANPTGVSKALEQSLLRQIARVFFYV